MASSQQSNQQSTQQSNQSSQSTGISTAFQGLEGVDQEMARALILELLGGGTADYKAMRSARNADKVSLQELSRDYTNDAAFSDAGSLMALNLQNSMEKQMPALAKAVQGAGTSASSMQGLLSNKIAQDASLSAGALGAEQAKAYGAIQANMRNTIESYTRGDDQSAQNLIKALDLLKVSKSRSDQQSTSQGSSSSQSTGSSSGTGTDPARESSSSSGGTRASGTTPSGGTSSGWSNTGGASTIGGVGTFTSPNPSYTPQINDEPFYYDDWGTGSTAYGDMASNPSASGGYDYTPNEVYYFDDWNVGSDYQAPSYQPYDNNFADYGATGWDDYYFDE